MIVTDVKYETVDKKGIITKKKGYYMDGYMVENMAGVPRHLKRDWDCVGIVSGSGKVRVAKCVGKETKVKIFDKGKIKESKPLGEYQDGKILKTVSWDFENNKRVESESKVIRDKNKKKLYNVELENGKIIKCSMDHKLFVKRKFCNNTEGKVWKIVELKLKDIKIGDELVCQTTE